MLLGEEEKLCEKAYFFGGFCRKSHWFHEKVHPSIVFLYFFIKNATLQCFFRILQHKKSNTPMLKRNLTTKNATLPCFLVMFL